MQVIDRKIALKQKSTCQKTFDSPWKKILDRYFKDFMELCWPNQYAEVDWAKGYKMLDKELSKIDKNAAIGDRTVDKLIEIYCKNGEITYLILHLEIQRTPSADFTERMLRYRYRLKDLYNKPVASMAILIDTNPAWRPQIYREDVWGSWLEMGFPIIKVIDYQTRIAALERSSNPFAVVLLAQLAANQTMDARLVTKRSLTRLLYEKGWSKPDIFSLYAFIDWVVALPESLELSYYQYVEKLEKELTVEYVTSAERIGLQRGLKKGLAQGLEQGLEQGMEKGLEQGLERGLERGLEQGLEQGFKRGESFILAHLLEQKFSVVPEHYRTQIEQADTATILKWATRLLHCQSLEALFSDTKTS